MEQEPPVVPGYQVLASIGSGSSATVWRARREADQLVLAVKVIEVPDGEVTAAMREATVLARVRHAHLIHLYDVLPLPGPDGRPRAVALAVELAEGGSLAQIVAARRHLTAGETVTVIGPLAGALADLHRAGVIHGDLSAGNVLFRSDGLPMLADLGVCRIAGDRLVPVSGTDGMLAPELLEGLPPTADSDVYSLGALAWTCLTGAPPGWVGTRPDLAALVPDVPEQLTGLITACLSPEPSDRPDAEEVAVAILTTVSPEPVPLAPGQPAAPGLTQRLRRRVEPRTAVDDLIEDALGVTQADSGADVTAWTRAAWRRGGPPPDDGVGLHPRRWRPSSAAGSRGRSRAWIISAAVATLLLVAGVAWWQGASGSTSAAGAVRVVDVPAAQEVPAEPEVEAPTGEGTAAPIDIEAEPVSGLQVLLDARAAAWSSGDVADLLAAHVPGGEAWSVDSEDLERAASLGVAYQGLAFVVEDAHLVEHDQVGEEAEDSLVMRAQVVRTAYQSVPRLGAAQAHPESVASVTFELRLTESGWRIQRWS